MNVFGRRRARHRLPPDLRVAADRFGAAVEAVEEAKRSLAAAAPGGRGPGLPLAEALAGFEAGLARARSAMPGWRRPEVEDAWLGCRDGLELAARRAEWLRLGNAPDGYERLYATLSDLMAPLDAFSVAFDRFRTLSGNRWEARR